MCFPLSSILYIFFQNFQSAEDLDCAILDRCDESMLFPLPNSESRKNQILHYFNLYVKAMERTEKGQHEMVVRLNEMIYGKDKFSVTIENEAMDEKQVDEITKATEGFSGREIAKLMIAIQGNIYASTDGKLSREMITDIVYLKVKDHEMKIRMGRIESFPKTIKPSPLHDSGNEVDDEMLELDMTSELSPIPISPRNCNNESKECDLVLQETLNENDDHHSRTDCITVHVLLHLLVVVAAGVVVLVAVIIIVE